MFAIVQNKKSVLAFKKVLCLCVILVLVSISCIIPAFALNGSVHFAGDEWVIENGSKSGSALYPSYKSGTGSYLLGTIKLPFLDNNGNYTLTLNVKGYLQAKANFKVELVCYDSTYNVVSSQTVYNLESNKSFDDIVKINAVVPNNSSLFYLRVSLYSPYNASKYIYYCRNITLTGTDINSTVKEGFDKVNNELSNIHNSIDSNGDKIANAINPSVPYEPMDGSNLEGLKNDLNNAVDALPKVDSGLLDSLLNSAPVEQFRPAFLKINQMFEKIINITGLAPLLLFSLVFGLCMYLIGRI